MAGQAGPETTMVAARLDSNLARSMREVSEASGMTATQIIEQAVKNWLTLFLHTKAAADKIRRATR